MNTVTVELIGKPGCHLCDVAREEVDGVLTELAGNADAPNIDLREVSILDDPALHELYAEKIPVLRINGAEHSHWHIDAGALRAALLGAGAVG